VPTTRREFLRQSALAGSAAATLGPLASATAAGASTPSTASTASTASTPSTAADPAIADRAGWFDRPMRWSQLTLVEDDPAHFDPQFWLDYFARIHSDAVTLSAGGIVAYYPTNIPLHHRSDWLGDRDVFGDLVAGCRRLDMVVVARTDPHAVLDEVREAHPDWIAVDASGKPRRHWSDPRRWVTCALGPYNFEFMTAVHREIMSRYKVDGIFTNRWAGSGMCYCEHCRANFKKYCGLDLPRTNDPQDPARRHYIQWYQDRLFELWRLWDGEIQKINPGARYIPNAGGGANSSLDMATIGRLAPTLFADRQARSGLMAPWANGKNGKEYRATLGRKAIVGIFSVGVEEQYRWKDSVQNEAEIRIWVADGTANGLRPWYTKFSGTLHDRRWLATVEKIYDWHWRNEKYLRNEEPLARVAMVYSQQTGSYYGGKVEQHIDGFYHALIEARIPFEMVHDRLLGGKAAGGGTAGVDEVDEVEPVDEVDSVRSTAFRRPGAFSLSTRNEKKSTGPPEGGTPNVDRFKVLILPNIAALSDAQCEQLRQYVKRGGSLVATYETSLYDEWGKKRPDFGLADLFGVSFAGKSEGPMRNSYLRIERGPNGELHPLLRGLESAERIINGVNRLECSPERRGPTVREGADGRGERQEARGQKRGERQEAGSERRDYSPLTLIPSYPDLPMEQVFPRVPRTDIPEVYLREIGAGRVVYFPWDIDRTFWEVLCVDHGLLLRNAVEWAANEAPPVTVTGPGVLDVALWRQKDSMTVHLVNLTNPMMMKGPFRELIPAPEQKVRVRLPEGKRAKAVKLLVSEKSPEYEEAAGWVSLVVPSILDHEVVAIDL
jgi:hypothetical protein